jgi:putative nucleotidyltransferase with HDIG domain
MHREPMRRLRRRFVALAFEHAVRLGDRGGHIVLKRDHSLRVHALAAKIVAGEGLGPAVPYLAAALVHDIGRFAQFERFGTYRDDMSVDHGDIGAQVLREGGFLAELGVSERECVMTAVRLHNKRELPDGLDPLFRSVCEVVRDADKLDIVPVVLARMLPGGPRDDVVTLGLEDAPDRWSEGVFEVVAAGVSPAYSDMRFLNDFKLLLASWGPGLRHRASRRIFARRAYLDALFGSLPGTSRFAALKGELARRLER